MSAAARRFDIVSRVVTCGLVIGLGAVGLARPDEIVVPGLAWLGFLFCVLFGWGTIVAAAVRLEADAGLRMAWGAIGYLVIGGVLIALGVCTRPVILALIGLGVAGFAGHELTTDRPVWRRCLEAARAARRQPGTAALVAVLVALALVHMIAAVSRYEMNAYDDDVGYAALVKRVLDIGDLDEPFSFRRLSAYGGQTLLEALGGARGTLLNAHLVDRGLFQGVALLLLVGLARDKRVPAYWTALVIVAALLLPETSINIASHWSGMAVFIAMYRTSLLLDDERRVTRVVVVLAATAAVMGTLRQNFMPVSVLALLLILVFRLHAAARTGSWAAAWRADRRRWLVAIAVGAVCLGPYAIASWTSNRTFLYPFMPGTFNPNLSLRPEVFSIAQELKFFTWVFLEGDPIRVFPLLVPIALVVRDHRRGRPLPAFLIANAIGLAILIHGFTLSDPGNLWRYAFGYLAGLTLIYALEIGALGLRDDDTPAATGATGVEVPVFGRVVMALVLLAQVAAVRNVLPRDYREMSSDITESLVRDRRPGQMTAAARAKYHDLQHAVPAGAWLASMVDEPYYYDYARHQIINLDVPGYAGWAPGIPMFRGPEPVRDYFLGHGVRYLAFVRGDYSRYLYRREFWVRRIFVDIELWRIMGSYIVDALDNFDELALTSRVVFERDGTVVLDLGERR